MILGKGSFLRILLFTVSFIFLIAATYSRKPVIWVLGDSTACDVPSSVSYPPHYLMGWAQMLPDFFNTGKVEIQNHAGKGQSSRTFIKQKWPAFKDKIQKGDYLIIQFGHNDPKTDRDRLTIPGSTFEQYLMEYITHAKTVGAVPILTTPIERNNWDGDKVPTTHGKYPESMRNLAKKENVILVDLTQLTNDLYVKLGREATTKTIFYPGDSVHIKKTGATAISKLFTDELVRQKVMPICSWLKNPPEQTIIYPVSDASHLKKINRETSFYLSAGKVLCLESNTEKNLKVTIISLSGKTILSEKFNPAFERETVKIPLHGLSKGTYLMKSEYDGIPKVNFINILD